MLKSKYSCPNGCHYPYRKRAIRENDNHTYCFAKYDVPFCPKCGHLMPKSLQKLQGFFEVYNVHPKLDDSLNLVYKSEFESAVREASVTLENVLRKESNLDLHGSDLATKALSFEIDRISGEVIRKPLISINNLETESDRNEQEGIRFMLMGFFQGPRNLYLHNHIGSGPSNALSIIIEVSFFLHLLDGHSITKNGHWVPTNINFKEIYDNMPRRIDRWKLRRMLKKRVKKDLETHR